MTGPTGPTGDFGNTGDTGPQASVVDGTADIALTDLSMTGIRAGSTGTSVSTVSSYAWLNGYQILTTDGTPAVVGVHITPTGGEWSAYAAALALNSTTTTATVRVYYTYTA